MVARSWDKESEGNKEQLLGAYGLCFGVMRHSAARDSGDSTVHVSSWPL